ncbi:hypothetical protein MRB53_035686 [Persea americana]|uniref:Uncharacterized protein n=1 Tax=Persea americana TaxID=3435 RepID=A0ACC2K5B7_PERAE|nr:hypothetical protein MRB53_035686 [Persea americana]
MSRGLIVVLAMLCWWGWNMAMGEVPPCADLGNEGLPCIPYVSDFSISPSPPCCQGVKDIIKMGVTRADRQAICLCVKKAFSVIPNIDLGRAQILPHKCGSDTDIPIGPNVDCSKVLETEMKLG